YTWSEELQRIFQQDRLLQKKLEPADIHALTAALEAQPLVKQEYLAQIANMARLTNPPASDNPELFKPEGAWFFPPSRSHESDLVKRIYADRPIPDGFSLAVEMINRVRDGSIKLEPTVQSGWYDLQTWALEPLIVPERMPEGARLRMNDPYLTQLEDLFKA